MTTQDEYRLCSLPIKMSLLESFLNSVKGFKIKKGVSLTSIRSDYDGEIENENFHLVCEDNSILHNFSTLRTP